MSLSKKKINIYDNEKQKIPYPNLSFWLSAVATILPLYWI